MPKHRNMFVALPLAVTFAGALSSCGAEPLESTTTAPATVTAESRVETDHAARNTTINNVLARLSLAVYADGEATFNAVHLDTGTIVYAQILKCGNSDGVLYAYDLLQDGVLVGKDVVENGVPLCTYDALLPDSAAATLETIEGSHHIMDEVAASF